MSDIKKFQFILDGKIANNFKSELNKLGGTISGLNDTQVVVDFNENATMANFKKLYQKLEKENSDLTVQFRYDINKAMLQQAQNELSQLEVYVDVDKANKEILELVKGLKDINLKLEVDGITESDEDKLFKQVEEIADKIGKIISTHISIDGSSKMFDNLSDEVKEIIETFTNLNRIKDIKPFDIKNIEKQRKEVESIKSIMEELETKGAVSSSKGGTIDDAQIKELRDEISEVKEDITSLKGRVDTLEDTTAFDNLSTQVEDFDDKIKKTNDTLLNLKKTIRELTGQKSLGQVVTEMSEYGRANEYSGELLAYSSSSTGYTSNVDISDSSTGITKEFREEVYSRIKEEAEAIDTQIHSHPDNEIAAASYDDIGVMIRQLEDGITKQVVTSLSQVMTFDFDSTNLSKDELKSKLLDVFSEYKKWVFKYFSPIDEKGNLHELAPLTDEMENKIVEYAKELLKIFPDMDEDLLDSDVTQKLFQDKIKEVFSKHGLGDVVKLSNLGDIESSFSFSDIRKVADSAFSALTSQAKKAVEEGYADGQDSHSPSKEAEKLNDDFVAGVEESANKNANNLKNAGKQMAENVKEGFKEGISEIGTTALSDGNQNGILSDDESTAPAIEGQQKLQEEAKETINVFETLEKVSHDALSKDFSTSNKTQAFEQLKASAEEFYKYWESADKHTRVTGRFSEEGTKAAHSFYKSLEEALRKEVAQGRIEKVIAPFYDNPGKAATDMIRAYSASLNYGETTNLDEWINGYEERLNRFATVNNDVSKKSNGLDIFAKVADDVKAFIDAIEVAISRSSNMGEALDIEHIQLYFNGLQTGIRNAIDEVKILKQEAEVNDFVNFKENNAPNQDEYMWDDYKKLSDLLSDLWHQVADGILTSTEAQSKYNEELSKTLTYDQKIEQEIAEKRAKKKSDKSGVLLDEDTTAPIEESIKLQDNLGREIDENNAKLLKGTQLIDEQNKGILTLYHNSEKVFDNFDPVNQGGHGSELGQGNYLSGNSKEYNDIDFGRYQTQWYAFVKNIFDIDSKFSAEQIQKLIDTFLKGTELEGTEAFNNIVDTLNADKGLSGVRAIAKATGKTFGEIFGAVGYDAIAQYFNGNIRQINVFDSSKIVRANDIVDEIPYVKQLSTAIETIADNYEMLDSIEGKVFDDDKKKEYWAKAIIDYKNEIDSLLERYPELRNFMDLIKESGLDDPDEIAKKILTESPKGDKTEVLSGTTSTAENLEKVKETLTETRVEAENTADAIERVTGNKSNNTTIDGQEKLESNVEETTSAINEESKALDNLGNVAKVLSGYMNDIPNNIENILKITNSALDEFSNLLYHAGVLSGVDLSSNKSHVLGTQLPVPVEETMSFSNLTGLYTTNYLDGFVGTEWHDLPISVIDKSKLGKLFSPDELIGKLFKDFSYELESTIYGYNFGRNGKTTDNIKTIDELYLLYQQVFGNLALAKDKFEEFVNKSSNLVKNAEFIISDNIADEYNKVNKLGADGKIERDDAFSSYKLNVSNNVFNSDSFMTQLLKQMGFAGTDMRNTRYDSAYTGGSVLFDIPKDAILEIDKPFDEVMNRPVVFLERILDEAERYMNARKEIMSEIDNLMADNDGGRFDSQISKMKAELAEFENLFQNGIKESISEYINGIKPKEVNQTPLSSDDKIGENAKETAEEVKEANDKIVASNEEVIASEEKKRKYSKAPNFSNVTWGNNAEPIKDTFDVSTESSEMDKVATATDEAVQAKKDFAIANEGVQDSVDGSKSKLELEAELMEKLAKSAREAADAKKEFVKANKEVKDSEGTSDGKKSNVDKTIDKINSYNKTDSFFGFVKNGNLDNKRYQNISKEIESIIKKQGKYASSVKATEEEIQKLDDATQKFADDFEEKFQKQQLALADNLENKIKRITSGKTFDEDNTKIISDIEKNIDKLRDINLFDANDLSTASQVSELISDINAGINKIKNISNNPIALLPEPEDINKSIGQINKVLSGGYKIPRKLRTEFEQLRISYKNAFDSNGNVKITNAELQKLKNTLSKLNAEFEATGKHKSIMGSLTSRITDMNAKFLAQYFSFQDIVRYGQQGFETIKEYDKALTEMDKVSNESIQTLKEFQEESFGLADAVGTTASQIQNSTSDFLRLGESFEQAKQSAQDANALLKVSEFTDISEATDSLIAMSAAYDELEKSEINDILNYTGNNFSISTSELASALQRSAATLKVAGNDIYEATALVTAGNAVLQDAESVGTGKFMPEYIVICRFLYQKVAITVKSQRWSRPWEGYNIC